MAICMGIVVYLGGGFLPSNGRLLERRQPQSRPPYSDKAVADLSSQVAYGIHTFGSLQLGRQIVSKHVLPPSMAGGLNSSFLTRR
jgi:hypothetical protein